MVRRVVCFLAVVVLTAGLGFPAAASQQQGEIRISLDYGEEAVNKGTVVLRYVAEPLERNYRLPESLGGGIIRREDSLSPELAQWLSLRTGQEETVRLLDADGCAVFSGLREGLYLLTQTEAPEGYACALPCLIPIPLDGQWQVQANPKTSVFLTESPKTGQHPIPLIGAMGLVLSGTGLYFCLEKLRKR